MFFERPKANSIMYHTSGQKSISASMTLAQRSRPASLRSASAFISLGFGLRFASLYRRPASLSSRRVVGFAPLHRRRLVDSCQGHRSLAQLSPEVWYIILPETTAGREFFFGERNISKNIFALEKIFSLPNLEEKIFSGVITSRGEKNFLF